MTIDCIFALADLHTITVRQEPAKFRRNILEAYALLLACGIDLDKSLFFMQSHVPYACGAGVDSELLHPVRRAFPHDPV